MKKLKKLILKKEVITQLNKFEMTELNGGAFATYGAACPKPGGTQNSCTVAKCIPL